MLAVVFLFLGACLVLVLPETLHLREHKIGSSTTAGLVGAGVTEDEEDIPSDDEGTLTLSKKNWTMLLEKFEESRFVFTDPKLLALSITFLVQSLHGNMNQFLLQLASKRLNWTLADVCAAPFSNFIY